MNSALNQKIAKIHNDHLIGPAHEFFYNSNVNVHGLVVEQWFNNREVPGSKQSWCASALR